MPVELISQSHRDIEPLQSGEMFPFLVAAMIFAIAFAAIDKWIVQARYGFRNHKAHIINFLVCATLAATSCYVMK